MQKKPSFPVNSCIKTSDISSTSGLILDDESHQHRLQLVNFGHSQWGFNNWSWSVNKQELDFVDFTNGKYTAGVVAYVSIIVKKFDIHRDNVGYATCSAVDKGAAIHRARKCAATNALRETLLSFGGSVASELLDVLEADRLELGNTINQSEKDIISKPEIKIPRKDEVISHPANVRPPVKNAASHIPPVATAHPMPANRPILPPAANAPRPPPPPPVPAPQHIRPNSNEQVSAEEADREARAERKRRQRQAQEEFRLKQMMKQKSEND